MTSGGARARSGPAPDPNSARSERRGLSFAALPPDGRHGETPEFPLPRMDIFDVDGDGKRESDMGATEVWAEREKDLWEWAWTTPQAVAWEKEPWRWYTVAQWVRLAVTCEQSDAKAADKTALLKVAEQIGLTPAGLTLNRWAITAGDDAEKDAPKAKAARKKSSRERANFKVVNGGGR